MWSLIRSETDELKEKNITAPRSQLAMSAAWNSSDLVQNKLTHHWSPRLFTQDEDGRQTLNDLLKGRLGNSLQIHYLLKQNELKQKTRKRLFLFWQVKSEGRILMCSSGNYMYTNTSGIAAVCWVVVQFPKKHVVPHLFKSKLSCSNQNLFQSKPLLPLEWLAATLWHEQRTAFFVTCSYCDLIRLVFSHLQCTSVNTIELVYH